MFGIEVLGWCIDRTPLARRRMRILALKFVPPEIPALLHRYRRPCPAVDNDALHARTIEKCFVHSALQAHFLAAPPTAVRCDHDGSVEILDAQLQSLRRKPTEHDAMGHPHAGACQYRDWQPGN